MRIENHIHIRHISSSTSRKVRTQHSHFAISTNLLTKEPSAKVKLKNGTQNIAFLQWTPFGISLSETPSETQQKQD